MQLARLHEGLRQEEEVCAVPVLCKVVIVCVHIMYMYMLSLGVDSGCGNWNV